MRPDISLPYLPFLSFITADEADAIRRRITFNCVEKFPKGQEIVVLIGDRAMSINGESYTTPENVPFEEVVGLFASKYTYFVK